MLGIPFVIRVLLCVYDLLLKWHNGARLGPSIMGRTVVYIVLLQAMIVGDTPHVHV